VHAYTRDRSVGEGVEERVVDWIDAKHEQEGARRYIEFRRSTLRGTRVATLFRCFTNGSNLYFAADSYVLGDVRWMAVVGRVLISLVILRYMFAFAFMPVVGIFALLWLWWEAGRASLRDGPMAGLRWAFPKPLTNSSFDIDDSLMFLKALLPMITQAVDEALRSVGLEEESVHNTLRAIEQKVGGQSITLQAGGDLSVGGPVISGSSNRITGRGRS
jgi:hypothetical protein